jgi:hypothetical protein
VTVAQWLAPSPLWREPEIRGDRAALARPVLLRFASDQFMDELQRTLTTAPETLRGLVAQPETWQAPAVGLGALPAGSTAALKLFQPAHQRFYVLTASLACKVPGFPDHTVRPEQQETVTFVVRRLVPTAGGDVLQPDQRTEQGWVPGTPGAWVAASGPLPLAGEEELPLFPMAAKGETGPRRIHGALVPVGKRETYAVARTAAAATPAPVEDARLIELQRQVIDPWAELLAWYDRTPPADRVKPAFAASVSQTSALILLDFARFLAARVSAVSEAIQGGPAPTGPAGALYAALAAPTGSGGTLRVALRDTASAGAALESAVLPTPAPGQQTAPPPSLPAGVPDVSLAAASLRQLVDRPGGDPAAKRPLVDLVERALPAPAAPAPTLPVRAPGNPRANDWFVARCVYRRPRCGPVVAPLVSDPSVPFQLASYFDADAPARPLTVVLPIDTTPAGLRKADKGVAFVISQELSRQMNRVTGLKQLMDGEVADPGLGIGFICSLSIPIITICAFLVLMIFIQLLNIVFWWLPFFKICFPVPKLEAKG